MSVRLVNHNGRIIREDGDNLVSHSGVIFSHNSAIVRTLKNSGGDYSTMSGMESSEQTDLVAIQASFTCECYSDFASGLNEQCTWAGWTVNSDFFITIKAAAGHEHNGVFGDGFYMYWNEEGDMVVDIQEDYTRVEDVEFRNQGTGGTSGPKCINLTADYVKFNRVLMDTTGGTATATHNGCLQHYYPSIETELNHCILLAEGGANNGAVYTTSYSASDYLVRSDNTIFIQEGTNASSYGFNCASSNNDGDKVEFNRCLLWSDGSSALIRWAGGVADAFTGDYNIGYPSGGSNLPGANSVYTLVSGDFTDKSTDDYSINDIDSSQYDGGGATTGTDIAGNTYNTDDAGPFAFQYGSRVKTLRSSGGDYSTMSGAESGEQVDLVEAAGDFTLQFYDDWPSGLADAVSWDGWTTGSGNDVTVEPAAGQDGNGTPGDGFYMTDGVNWTTVFDIRIPYMTVNGVEVRKTGGQNGTGFDMTSSIAGLTVTLDSCIAQDCIGSGTGGFYFNRQTMRNCLAIGCLVGFHNKARHFGGIVENCTADKSTGNGFYSDGGSSDSDTSRPRFQNCVAYASTSPDFYFNEPLETNSGDSNNASEDSTAPGSNSVTGITSAAFNNYATEDYEPANGGVLQDAGADLTATFTTSLNNRTRDSDMDIGAYESITVAVNVLNSELIGALHIMKLWQPTPGPLAEE